MYGNCVEFSVLKGQIFNKVERVKEKIIFENNKVKYELYHEQDCCESVYIEDICGDLNDLVDTPITFASESYSDADNHDDDSSTWSFYKIATIKGWVDIRFYGSSNGYYSEDAHLYEIKKMDNIKTVEKKDYSTIFDSFNRTQTQGEIIIWHNLRENPNNTPTKSGIYLDEDGFRVYWDNVEKQWYDKFGFVHKVRVYAWCNLPKYIIDGVNNKSNI